MATFLIPLLLSFACNIASAFTAAHSRRWGPRRGQLVSTVLRNVLGIPLLGLAFVLAARQQVPRLLPAASGFDLVGGAFLIAGIVLILWSLFILRLRAAAPSVADTLARQGPYALVRHPLYSGVFCEVAGALLVRPTWPIWLSCLLSAGWLVAQARAEERDLLERLPGYRAYMAQVPRFVPRLKR